ncbi:MAG: phospholipase D-like domain-containing protein [Vibrio sp.]
MLSFRKPCLCLLSLVLLGCSTPEQHRIASLQAIQENVPKNITNETELFDRLYLSRTWVDDDELSEDPIEVATLKQAPLNKAQVKIVGVAPTDAHRSLATKIWMIDNAEHTLDLAYYIFKPDLAGYAVMGALCNAVERGVDVRVMVDSLGSFSFTHNPLKALTTCNLNAGYIKDLEGNPTKHKARIQFVIINALTDMQSNSNRRSHDKLIIKDGNFIKKDMIMTGGRNLALDYYALDENGDADLAGFRDLEMLLRSNGRTKHPETGVETSLGDIASLYYSFLFLHKGNRLIKTSVEAPYTPYITEPKDAKSYQPWLDEAQKELKKLRNSPLFAKPYQEMDQYLSSGFIDTDVRLEHQLTNFVSVNVIEKASEIKQSNANSIKGLLNNILQDAQRNGKIEGHYRIISPYLFAPSFQDKLGHKVEDSAIVIKEFLDKYPGISFEVITNSIITSDNDFTQSVIDMDTAPRLLLPDRLRRIWIDHPENSKKVQAMIHSKAWQEYTDNPRLKIYQIGRIDSTLLGGDKEYGLLHAKFFFSDKSGFVGTSNFDYRSRLYNNEMGFNYVSEDVSKELSRHFESLKGISYRWGSPEWFAMRDRIIQTDNVKKASQSTQRVRFRIMKATGLIWLF